MAHDDDDKTEHPPLVDLHEAKTPFEAQVIAGVLRDAGIGAYVAGGSLTDEFAMSQQLMNLQSVRVKVRAVDLDAAREALAAAREAGKQFDEDGDAGGDAGGDEKE